ncbi:MAG: hypothetical protein JEY91_13685 [Spirochaetaceae bacterium]|nr:hypothetical protein [Spirochaetaceae bacterium]
MIFIIIVAVIILLIFFRYYLSQPIVHKVTQNQLGKYFKILLYRGYDGGYTIIEGSLKKTFLQYKKYITENEVYLEMSFPKAKWSQEYYDRLKEYLEKREIKYRINNSSESPIEFIDINCSNDIDFCTALTRDIFVNIFDYTDDDLNYKIKFYDVSPKDEKIGF